MLILILGPPAIRVVHRATLELLGFKGLGFRAQGLDLTRWPKLLQKARTHTKPTA